MKKITIKALKQIIKENAERMMREDFDDDGGIHDNAYNPLLRQDMKSVYDEVQIIKQKLEAKGLSPEKVKEALHAYVNGEM